MTLKLGQNIAAMGAVRQLNGTSVSLATAYERLSSGMRINSAADDAAGLSVATSLNAQSKILSTAIKNLNDGLSLVNIADAALDTLTDITSRLKELATEAANGTYSIRQRNALDDEADALVDEYNRILSSTTYNGINLFDGSRDEIVLQAGIGANATLTVGLTAQTPTAFVGDGSFGAVLSQNVGAGTGLPRGSALGDFNGDGILDIIVADDTAQRANVMFGNGDGSFRPAGSYATQNRVYAITVGDFNNDGKADYATSDHFFGTSVFLNNGDGTFNRSATVSITTVSDEIASGDLNGDGILDLVLPQQYSAAVSVLYGNGNGTFRAPISIAAGYGSGGVELVDVNGDGKLDIVTTNETSSALAVVFNTGSGTFAAPRSVALPTNPHRLVAGDYNDDGKVDFAALSSGGMMLLLGNGDGTFRAGLSMSDSDVVVWSLATGDFNSDGNTDFAVKLLTPAGANNRIGIMFGNGNGTFSAISTISGIGGSSSVGNATLISVGDLNGDGVDDLTLVDGIGRLWSTLSNTDRSLRLERLNLNTREYALQALPAIDSALTNILDLRSRLGSAASRIEILADSIGTMRENYMAAADRIMSADVAQESANVVRLKILQNAAAGVLASANQDSSLVLRLLRSD